MEVLVCGFDAAERIESILRELGSELVMRRVTAKDELIAELAKGQQQICVVEHLVPTIDAVKVWNQLHKATGLTQGLFHIAGILSAGLISKRQETLTAPMTAYDLLPELVSRSPKTQFVITSHTRGSGLSPEQRALYKERQEVLKVMGFVNSTANYHYLAKLFSRVYYDRTWKPKPYEPAA